MHIEWNDSYSVGVKIVDEQHKTILRLINRLSKAISAHNGQAVLGEVLDELKSYTITHFETEENLMKEMSFSGYSAHKAEHEDLIAQVDNLLERFNSNVKVLNVEVLGFLVLCLENHIAVTDKDLCHSVNMVSIE